jgi:hypothetical protein
MQLRGIKNKTAQILHKCNLSHVGHYMNSHPTWRLITTSKWARVTRTCEILKLENMDEDRCYVELYFYNKLSSLKPSNMSGLPIKHIRGTKFGSIRRETCMILRGNLLPHPANCCRHLVNCCMQSASCCMHSTSCCMHSASGCGHQS